MPLRGCAIRSGDRSDLIGPGDLSMGMSGDYEIAIEEGSTCVRVGQPSSARGRVRQLLLAHRSATGTAGSNSHNGGETSP